MRRLILATILLMCSMNAIAETSVCNGTWENRQPVHVLIDWDKNTVNVNGVVTRISNVTSNGIYTSRHKNKFGHSVAFGIINSTYDVHDMNGIFLYRSSDIATFVTQVDIDTTTMNVSHALYCIKSFTKPFMARVI